MKTSLLILAITAVTASGLSIPHNRGEWPESWPKELEALRERAKTTEWATGSQEDSHQISFESRDDFEKYWPAFIELLGPGSILKFHGPDEEGNIAPGVEIQAPSASVAFDEKAKTKRTFKTGYTWPKSAYLPDGTLPEYVEAAGPGKYVPLKDIENPKGFRYRARIDIVLFCDGKIIDLNRIAFPKGIKIDDQRFKSKK